MGLAWTDGGGRGRASGGCTGRGVPKKHTNRKRVVGRAAVHGNGLSEGVLSALSWLFEVLSALGVGAVSKSKEHQQQGGRGRDVKLGAGRHTLAGNRIDPRPVLLVTLDSSTFRGVISFGVAGGLDPSLKSGDVVVATEVFAGDTRFLAGLALNEEMIASAALKRRRVVRGVLTGVERVIAATACKAALRSETGAAAVDMESHIAAAYAAEAGLPFAALRVISDPANRSLPLLAKSAIKPNGEIDLRGILRGVVRNPRTLRGLVSMGIDFNRALRSLRGCRGFLLGSDGFVAAYLLQSLLHLRREHVLGRPLVGEADFRRHRTISADAAQRHPHRLQRVGQRRIGRGRLIAAMRHAVGALLVLAGAVGV